MSYISKENPTEKMHLRYGKSGRSCSGLKTSKTEQKKNPSFSVKHNMYACHLLSRRIYYPNINISLKH
jgi:hypothetical protein